MKAAAAVFKREDYMELTSYDKLLDKADKWLGLCHGQGIGIIVFPALLGSLFNAKEYIKDIIGLSDKYKGVAVCPGSWHEQESGQTYHTSCIIMNGNIIMKQRQIYLAKWEQSIGLSRGIKLDSTSINGIKTSIIISTDIFYPQVSRAAALSGAELVLSPMAVIGDGNMSRQLSGLWQNVQANLFFGMESGFRGSFKGREFNSRSMIHAPLEMTEKETGFMAVEGIGGDTYIITAELDNEKRKEAVKKFNTLAQLNIEAYKDMFASTGRGGRNA